ncbi:MAG: hypothetical protein WAO19_07730 [Candidatus Kryptoniota bacterium]
MRRAVAVFAIAILLSVNAVMAQVHIKENAIITPRHFHTTSTGLGLVAPQSGTFLIVPDDIFCTDDPFSENASLEVSVKDTLTYQFNILSHVQVVPANFPFGTSPAGPFWYQYTWELDSSCSIRVSKGDYITFVCHAEYEAPMVARYLDGCGGYINLQSEEGDYGIADGFFYHFENWGISLYWLQTLDHFDVTVSPDTIANSDSGSTIIYVQAKDSLDQDICNYDGFIQISASPTGYGDLGNTAPIADAIVKGNAGSKRTTPTVLSIKKPSVMKLQNKTATMSSVQSTGKEVATTDELQVGYWYANNGYLYYSPDGTVPQNNTTITFAVSDMENPNATGKGSLMIKGSGPNLNFPRYSQGDSPWGGKTYDHSDETISEAGCALCGMAWVLSAFGYEINPLQLNDWMNERTKWDGGFDGSKVNWDALSDLSDGNLTATPMPADGTFGDTRYAYDVSILDNYLNNGDLVIAEVNNGGDKHWVVVEPKTNGEYPIVDAGYGDRTTMDEYYDNNIWKYIVVSTTKGK